MTTSKDAKPVSKAAAAKAERDRDKAQALRDYEGEGVAWRANMARLRALRLAKEQADLAAAKAEPAAAKRKPRARTRPASGGEET